MKKRKITPNLLRPWVLGIFFLCSTTFSWAQQTITGTVTSEDGPLPGASVVVKGTTRGTSTDFDGNYTIEASTEETLEFSYIGYSSKSVLIGNQSQINVNLTADNQLEEVVVVGYGTQKKVNLTGSVGLAKGEVLENRPISSVGQGLQGVIPGLNITAQNGDPTGGVDFNIRGFESINGGSPLILVDNVPMDLNQINPNDIESISVLKDASASAIYGARAAFGVILVTTKKGKKGKAKITLSTEQTVTSPIFLVEPITNPYVYMTNQNDIAALNGQGLPYDDTRLADAFTYSQNPTLENAWSVRDNTLFYNGYNDYQDKVITDQAFQNKYDLSVSGASEDASYYASVGYLGKKGYLVNDSKNQKFERFNALLRADFKINDWLSLDSKVIYTNTSNDVPHNYSFNVAINSVNRMVPIEPLEFPDLEFYNIPGDRADYERYIGQAFSNMNTLPYIEQGSRDEWNKHDLWLKQGLTITPFEGFVLKSDFSYNTFFQSTENVASKISLINTGDAVRINGVNLTNLALGNGQSANDQIVNRTQYNQYFVFNIFGEYTYDKIKNHSFKILAGFNQEELITRRLQGSAFSLITPGITDLNATTGTQEVQGGRVHAALRGAFYRFNYDYKGKYLLEVNGRYDGTSRFPKEDRFGFFPSFSTGWRISEESFMSGTSEWLGNLKIRASYGELGNQIYTQNGNQNYYPYVPSLNSGTSDFNLGQGLMPIVTAAGLVSPTLTWESVNTRNFGLDASFLKGKLDLTADVFVRETTDMLLRVNLPDILGASEPLENGADLQTKGWEISVNWRDKIGEDWNYSLGFNLADNKTKITKYGGENPNINGFYEGKDIGEIWGFQSVGLFNSDEAAAAAPDQSAIDGGLWQAGDIQYADLNDDGVIDRGTQTLNTETGEYDTGDLKVIGNTSPRYSVGFTPRAEYKGLSMSLFFQGILKRDYYPDTGTHAPFWPYNGDLVTVDHLENSWSPTNTDAYFARPRLQNVKNIQNQTRYLQNAAYVRLKNVTLNYNFPQDLVEGWGMSNAAIYISGENLWETSKLRSTLDPEQINSDIDADQNNNSNGLLQQYYFERSLSIGLKVTF
ncbi:SusC/RagA family TonB-linked outer membrane protein [Maribacter luteus]|uniref:SusC/RagA family TonB-linked outer membrane protein n=1 Tax=Maribacter luteus TaxID=2594478 RepID=UPI0024933D74|nr:TonB-dependent receptor [Maribacter luteus]